MTSMTQRKKATVFTVKNLLSGAIFLLLLAVLVYFIFLNAHVGTIEEKVSAPEKLEETVLPTPQIQEPPQETMQPPMEGPTPT